MLQNYLLITLRSIIKNKIFILINVLGMGIAVACCIDRRDSEFRFIFSLDFLSVNSSANSALKITLSYLEGNTEALQSESLSSFEKNTR